MLALVTGGAGFLGSEIVKLLRERDVNVRVFCRTAHNQECGEGIEYRQGDLSDTNSVANAAEGCDVVFHTAAKAGIWGSQSSYYETNVIGTRNIINACKQHKIGHLIYTSTPSVVCSGKAFRGEDESLPYGENWLCHYAETKAAAEREALASSRDDLKVTALRPHLIWGVGDPHILPRIVAAAKRGKLAIIGDGQNKVDITHVKDAARAHLLAWDAQQNNRAVGKAYFISQGKPVKLWLWINELLHKLDEPIIKKRISLSTAYRIGSIMEGIYTCLPFLGEPRMTRFAASQLGKDHYFDIAAARRDLDYKPLISQEEGLAELVDQWQKNIAQDKK